MYKRKTDYLSKLKYVYVFLIAFSFVPLVTLASFRIDFSRWYILLFWLLLEIAADIKPFRTIIYFHMDATLSFAVQMAMLILLDTWEAIWIVTIATLITEIFSCKQWYKAFFNVGQYAITLLVASITFNSLKLSDSNSFDIIQDLPAVLITVLIYYMMNSLLVSVVIALFSNNKFSTIFFNSYKVLAIFYFSNTPISIAAALLYNEQRPYTVLILLPSLIMANQALRWYDNLHAQTIKTLNVIADIVDQRDKYTYSHSLRVAEYAQKIAEELELSSDIVNEIEAAGRVHDLGKIAISDFILNKPDKLTKEEYEKIKEHPVVGYRILKNLKPYKNGAKFVLHHHERMNGKGYPEGLSGYSIPLGARIIAVADSYDAMTSDRPYRSALPQWLAVEELKKYSGIQFDPAVVKAFIEVLKRDYGYNENTNEAKASLKSENV